MNEALSDPTNAGQQWSYSLVLDLIQAVNAATDSEAVFGQVADALRALFAIDRFALVLLQEGELRIAHSRGLSAEYLRAAEASFSQAAGARSLAERRPVFIPDAAEDAAFAPLQDAAGREGFHTVLIVPFFAGLEPLGYIIMYHNHIRVYTPPEIMLAQTLAQQAAFTVQHAGIREESDRRWNAMQHAFEQRLAEARAIDDILLQITSSLDLELTLQRITEVAAQFSDALSSCIYLRDADGRFRARSSHGLPLRELQSVDLLPDEGLLREVLRTGRPAQVSDFRRQVQTSTEAYDVVATLGARATLAVPLTEGDRCIGALYVASRTPTVFADETVHVLERLAAFAQVAVRNARRFSSIEEERSRLQAYLDAIPEGVIVYDRDERVVMVNDTLRREFGIRGPIVGQARSALLAPSLPFFTRPMTYHYDVEAVFRRVLSTGQAEEGLLTLHDPEATFEVHFAPLYDEHHAVSGLVSTLRDITEPLELERERSRANVLARLLELSARLNSDLSVAALSEEVVDVARDLIGARAGTLGLIEGDRLVFRRFRLTRGWVDFDIALTRGEGGPGHVWATQQPYISPDAAHDPIVLSDVQRDLGFRRMVTVPVINREGRMLGTLGVYDPIVEREFGRYDVETLQLLAHQAAIAIENARLNETKDAFLSIVSHELKTPVTSIKGFAQVLQRRLSPESRENAARYLEVINQQADRLTALINDLLDLSRIQTGRFHFPVATIEYGTAMREVVEEMSLILPANTIVLHAPDRISARGNANRLRQVLVNLIENAAQHGPPGGTISITVEADGPWVRTYVCDEGPGLPPAEIERIFSPYYQVHGTGNQPARGLGLGLYICRQVVEQHGGRIWVDPEDHTSFAFTIPLAD